LVQLAQFSVNPNITAISILFYHLANKRFITVINSEYTGEHKQSTKIRDNVT